MKNIYTTMSALMLAAGFATSASAAVALTAGQYSTVGTVTSATSQCSAVGLAANAANNSVLTYPGAGKTGLTIYVPTPGVLQLCTGFPAVPAAGLSSFTAAGKCAIYSTSGDIPAQPVDFTFKSTAINAFSAVGTTTISIPATDTIGGGCKAVVSTTTVFTGLK
jgi:hypothetical protein